MQLDDLSNQQNGNNQSLPEPITTAQTVYNPSPQFDPQLQQGLNQQLTAVGSEENYIQGSTKLQEGIYQQSAGHLHPGAYQQPGAVVPQVPHQPQTVSEIFLWQPS